jgi:archaellum biogenesis ATPase FlaH
VDEKPTRVIYLCPEMGAASFVKRIKSIGLGEYVGKTLFVQTMNERQTALDDLNDELNGAVVIVDTITRFIEGDENKSEDMRHFAKKAFRLVNRGATVILLHHSKKGSSGTLDDGLRGSSELAAFVDSCWVTELDDPTKPYESLSKVRNVKQRDFESDPFRLKPAPGSFYLTMDGDPAPEAVIRDKKEQAARDALAEILSRLPTAGINKLRDELKAKGYGKGQKWLTRVRCEILGKGATFTSD